MLWQFILFWSMTCLFVVNYHFLQLTVVSMLFHILGLDLEAMEKRVSYYR